MNGSILMFTLSDKHVVVVIVINFFVGLFMLKSTREHSAN